MHNISKIFLVKAVQWNDLYYLFDFPDFNNNVSFGRKNIEFNISSYKAVFILD